MPPHWCFAKQDYVKRLHFFSSDVDNKRDIVQRAWRQLAQRSHKRLQISMSNLGGGPPYNQTPLKELQELSPDVGGTPTSHRTEQQNPAPLTEPLQITLGYGD